MSKLLSLIATAAALFAAAPGHAQDAYPSRPIKIVVCLPAGGGVDTVTRIIADRLPKILGQPVVVENKGGQSGNLGAEFVFSCRAGRLHAAGLAAGADHHLAAAVQEAQLRSDQVRAGRGDVGDRQHAAGASGLPGQQRQGVHRLRQGQSRQAQLRVAGQRHHLASDRRDVRRGDRHQDEPRALSRHRAGDQRPARRSRRSDVQRARHLDRAAQGRHAPSCSPSPPRSASTNCRTCRPWRRPGVPNFISDTWNAISAPPKTPAADRRQAQRRDQPGFAGARR